MKSKQSVSLGIFHMVISALAFGTMTAFVKFASETIPPFQIVFLRSLFGSILIAAVMAKSRISFLGTNRRMLILRGVFGFIALIMNFYAIAHMHLGTAVILNSTSPIFVAILAGFLLREKLSPRLWVLTLMCFAGIYFLVGANFEAQFVPATVGLLSGVLAALAFITISMSKSEENSFTIILYFTGISTIGSLPLLQFGQVALGAREWFAILGITISSFFGQVFLTKSLREAPASVVVPFNYLMPVSSFIYGFVLWKDPISASNLFGAFLIILSGTLIYILERKSEPIND